MKVGIIAVLLLLLLPSCNKDGGSTSPNDPGTVIAKGFDGKDTLLGDWYSQFYNLSQFDHFTVHAEAVFAPADTIRKVGVALGSWVVYRSTKADRLTLDETVASFQLTRKDSIRAVCVTTLFARVYNFSIIGYK